MNQVTAPINMAAANNVRARFDFLRKPGQGLEPVDSKPRQLHSVHRWDRYELNRFTRCPIPWVCDRLTLSAPHCGHEIIVV